ncbi:unnamed protein product [Trichobilharzia szidati]|nr:unnamed protein product [Trichobilharzia szidati]
MFITRGAYTTSSNTSIQTTDNPKMVLGCGFQLDCHMESSKHNFVNLEEFPALTKSKPISFSGAAWKKQIILPIEDFMESESAGNDSLSVLKKKRLKKKRKQTLYNEGSTSGDSSPTKDNDGCFFSSEEVKDTDVSQLSLCEAQFEFLKSQSSSDVFKSTTDKCVSESPVIETVSSLQVEDEGFAEELIDCTNHPSVCLPFPRNKSDVVSDSVQLPLQVKPTCESQRVTSLCSSLYEKDQVVPLGLNYSASNSVKQYSKHLLKPKISTNTRPNILEQYARSTSPSNLFDTNLSSKDTNDFTDEDDMEGTDLLHLISNSLDRFNAIVHPPDNLSTLTSGLGESRGILSESDSNSYSQDCLFPADIVVKPSTEYKASVSVGRRAADIFGNVSLSSLNSDMRQTIRLLDAKNPKNYMASAVAEDSKCNTSCPSFGHLALSLPYSRSNEVTIASYQQPVGKTTTYYSNYSSAIPIGNTSGSVLNELVGGSSIRSNNNLMDKSKAYWPNLLVSSQSNSKVLTPSMESSNNFLTDLITNNKNVLTDNDIDMLSYLNLDLDSLITSGPTTIMNNTAASTTNTITPSTATNSTASVNHSSLHSQHHRHQQHCLSDVSRYDDCNWAINDGNKCKSMNLFTNSAEDENMWNSNKSFHSNIPMLKTQSSVRQPLQSAHQSIVSSLPSSLLLLQHPKNTSTSSIDMMKYDSANSNPDKIFINSCDNNIMFSSKCVSIPSNRNGKTHPTPSYSLTSGRWCTESSNNLECVSKEMLLSARSHSAGYHQSTSVCTTSSTPFSINQTPSTVIMSHSVITPNNSTTNCLPIIGHSASASSNKVKGGLPPICNSSTVRNHNGPQDGHRNTHCRRHNNSMTAGLGNNSVSSISVLNTVKSSNGLSNSTSNSHLSNSKSLTHSHSSNQATAVTTDSTSLCPGTELVNGKPVVAKWRRACSFYLRGHCKKEDCEFAHDLTKVTCKFWEMGECFKGSTCPFLHGYPPELTME